MDPIPEAKNLPFVPSAGAETNAHRGQPTEDSPPLPRAPASSPHEATNSIIAGNCEASLKIGSSKEFFLSSVLLQSLSLFYVVPMMRGISSKKKKKKKKKWCTAQNTNISRHHNSILAPPKPNSPGQGDVHWRKLTKILWHFQVIQVSVLCFPHNNFPPTG